MIKKKSLKWGETPWDNMTKEELLREVQRMYSALRSLYSVMRMEADTREHFGGNMLYFGKSGVGGAALEKGRQVIEPLFEQYDGEEDIYRSFFRYADDLLFDRSTGYMIGDGWAICPECGSMYGETSDGKSSVGELCSAYPLGKKGCKGVLRALTWDDFKT